MYVHQSMNGYLPFALNNNFIYLHNLHVYNTHGYKLNYLKLIPMYMVVKISDQSATTWNYLLKKCPNILLYRHPKFIAKGLSHNSLRIVTTHKSRL